MFIRRDENAPRKAPDAFLADWSRGWVIGLGVALIAAGTAATALVLVYFSPFSGDEPFGNRMSMVALAVSVVVVGFGVVCLFRKPSAGSAPGSAKYEELVAKQERDKSNYVRRRIVTTLILLPLAFAAVLIQRLLDAGGAEISNLFWIAGAIALAMGILGLVLFVKDRKKEREAVRATSAPANRRAASDTADR